METEPEGCRFNPPRRTAPATTKATVKQPFSFDEVKMFYIYVIKSREGFRYTGMTEDLEKRLIEHNEKKLSFWTKRGTNWELIYKEEFETKSEALKREKWLKSGVGRDYLKRICSEL